jgi:hypothetical protein
MRFAYPAGAANTTVVKISKKTLDLINVPLGFDRHRAHARTVVRGIQPRQRLVGRKGEGEKIVQTRSVDARRAVKVAVSASRALSLGVCAIGSVTTRPTRGAEAPVRDNGRIEPTNEEPAGWATAAYLLRC